MQKSKEKMESGEKEERKKGNRNPENGERRMETVKNVSKLGFPCLDQFE